MLSIREIQEKTVGFFVAKGVPNPKLDTDLLIAHVLGIKRLELYLDLNRPLTEAQLDKLRPLVKRRSMREPLQYIMGRTEFCGMSLKVDSRALIPRQETEELIELICTRLSTSPKRILDMGTGSGAIAIALAAAYPDAEVWATDQSEDALALAKENAANFADGRIRFKQGSWWAALPEGQTFDLIVSNPPYLTEAEMQTAEPEVVTYEPSSALVSGKEGLEDLKTILSSAKTRLAPGGLLALETGIAQHIRLDALCSEASLEGEGIGDMSGRPRFYFVRSEHSSSNSLGQSVDRELRPNAASQLRKGRVSNPDTRYFLTCCTEARVTGLEAAPCAEAILTAIQQLHEETSIDLMAATVMPDHMHLLFKLGRRLSLSQVVGKFKSTTRQALADAGLSWQENYHEHHLRNDDALEGFSKYIFLNPYQAEVCETEQVWPWWVQNEAYRPEFLTLLDEPPLPPVEWIREKAELKDVIEDDL